LLAPEERYRDAARKATNQVDLGTDIYGVHFGGGWGVDASFAIGSLSGSDLTVWGARRCDSHQELLEAIVYFNGPWGLDFPFALPAWTYQTFSNRDWPALLDFADTFEEAQVRYYITAAGLDDVEDECRRPGGMCRVTDAESGAMSPMKWTRPNRLGMTHEGLRLLSRLRARGASVYPFDTPGRAHPRLYEVHPAGAYARLGLGDAPGPRDFVAAFNGWDGRAVDLSVRWGSLPVGYALDAVVSCATLANAIRAFDLDRSWDEMPACATREEWEIRRKEGLIVRL
jgi:hypothetical protein